MTQRMTVNSLVDRKVYIRLDERAGSDFAEWNLTASIIGCIVTGVDVNLGIWIRGDSFDFRFAIDKQGNKIPEERRVEEKVEVDIFLPWGYIKGIMDLKDERVKVIKDKKEIGFKSVD